MANLFDILLDDVIGLRAVAFEAHWRPVVHLAGDGKRKENELRRHRHERPVEQLCKPLDVKELRKRFLPADERARDDRSAGLEGEPHEPGTEAHELVAILVELPGASGAFRKYEHQALVVEQLLTVLGQASQVAQFPQCGPREGRPARLRCH